jgi:hypothetical protein
MVLKGKKGQVLLYSLMIVVFVFIIAIIMIEPIKTFITTARDHNNLDCSNTSISTGTRMACLVVDLYMFYFIGAVLAASIGFLFVRSQIG